MDKLIGGGSHARYGQSATKDKVWNNAKEIRGMDPNEYRKDPYGNIIRYNDYGTNKKTSWDQDHIIPKSRGGSDSIRNLQALQSRINRSKGDSLQKASRHSQSNK